MNKNHKHFKVIIGKYFFNLCEKDRPVVVEFSFRYKNKKEKYDGEAAKKTYDVFARLNDRLMEWVDYKGMTKTTYVYSR